MAILRRHWKLAAFNAILIVGAIIAITIYLVHGGVHPAVVRAQAVATPVGGAVQSVALNAQTVDRINVLRQQLCLTDGDLAAMSCTQDQATTILANLKTWYQTNSSAWNTDDGQVQSAQAALQEAWRKINVGPKDDALIGQLSTLQRSVANASQQRSQLFTSAASAVSSTLNVAQSSVWATAKANAAAPDQYRYVPNLTSGELQQLVVAIYHNASAPQAMSSVEQSVLSGDQRQAMSAIATAQAQSASAITAASAAAFPASTQPTTPQ